MNVVTTEPGSAIWTAEVEGRNRLTQLTTGAGGGHFAPAWMPDGKRVIFVGGRTATNGRPIVSWWSIDKRGGRPTLLSDANSLPPEFVLAADGRAIYYVPLGARTLWSMPLSAAGGTAAEPFPTGLAVTGSLIQHLAVSPDGRRVGWTATDPTNNLWALPFNREGRPSSGQPVRITNASNVRYGTPLPSASGRMALIGSRPGVANSIYVLDKGDRLRQLTSDPAMHSAQEWAPNGHEIAILVNHESAPGYAFVDVETGRERPWFPLAALPRPADITLQRGPESVLYALAPDLTQIAVTYVRDEIPNLWLTPLASSGPKGTPTQRTFEKEGGGYPSWSRDGQWIGYQCTAGANTHLCMVSAAGGDGFKVVDAPGTTWVGGWMPDNDRMMFAAKRDAVWNAGWVSRTSKKTLMLTRFTDPHSYVRYPQWDEANRRVVFERSEVIGRLWMVTVPGR